MKSCIILFCLLVVVYSKQVDHDRNLQQSIKDQFLSNLEDQRSVFSEFFSSLLELSSLEKLVTNILGWITGVFIASVFAQL